jgi:cation diffusion facilitator family transporter
MDVAAGTTPEARRDMYFAMRLSLFFGLAMLAAKRAAYMMTGSAAILSDAAESIVHLVAVAFAAFSLWLSNRPANQRYLYGYERISFFSAGFEGGMIVLAGFFIIAAAVEKWLGGLQIDNLGTGSLYIVAAAAVNAILGWYLVRTGRRHKSLILEANGKHVLTDSWTSFGVVAGLLLVVWTGWKPFDPIFAIAVGTNILWSGGKLIRQSAAGLLDNADPHTGELLRGKLDAVCAELGLQYHGVRFRDTGHRLLVEVHLLFPSAMSVGEAHRLATELEERLPAALGLSAEVITHLEASDDHEVVHHAGHYTGKPGGR